MINTRIMYEWWHIVKESQVSTAFQFTLPFRQDQWKEGMALLSKSISPVITVSRTATSQGVWPLILCWWLHTEGAIKKEILCVIQHSCCSAWSHHNSCPLKPHIGSEHWNTKNILFNASASFYIFPFHNICTWQLRVGWYKEIYWL